MYSKRERSMLRPSNVGVCIDELTDAEGASLARAEKGIESDERGSLRRDVFVESRRGPAGARTAAAGDGRDLLKKGDESSRSAARRDSRRTERGFCRSDGEARTG